MLSYETIEPLSRSFYLLRPQTVATALLGKVLIRILDDIVLAGRIVEVEAYLGLEDAASHAFRGKTPRNEVLFGPPGYAYVYFIYGMYSCLNFSCEPEGHAGGVLIRALEPLAGLGKMKQLRGTDDVELLTSGPGRLCDALGITRSLINGVDVTNITSPLRVVDDGFDVGEIHIRPRVGIRKAVDLPLRFLLAGNRHVSRR